MRTGLPADGTSARQARPATRQALAAWQMEHLSAGAELLASKLVAKPTEHGNDKPIRLVLSRHAQPDGRPGITCEVTASSPVMPRRRNPGADAECGRDLGDRRRAAPGPAACAPARPGRPAGSPSSSPAAPTGPSGRSTESPKPGHRPAP